MSSSEADPNTQQAGEFAERILASLGGMFEIFTIYIGDRLGFYRALAASGPMTAAQLAASTGTHERYAHEWLEQQAVVGILESGAVDEGDRRFALSPGHAEVLVEADSLDYLAPIARLAVGATRPLDAVLEAFRNGGGVPYADYGVDLREGQADVNRASFLQLAGSEWLPAMPDVHDRLNGDPPARIADFGCGAGWSSIGMARAYAKVRVDGFDLDEPSIELARRHVGAAELNDRVSLHVRDAGDPELAGRYDLVTAFECIHDMSQPVSALRTMRNLLRDGGVGLVVDERVGDSFGTADGDVEWLMYGWSVLHCLPVGMADQPSAATGTVMRAPTFEGYAKEAGFGSVTVLPIENLFFRFYRLDV